MKAYFTFTETSLRRRPSLFPGTRSPSATLGLPFPTPSTEHAPRALGACSVEGVGKGSPRVADGERVPGKSDGLLRKEVSVKVKYAFICGEEGNYPIEKMCVWAKVSRSGYYEWHGRGPSASQLRRRRLSALVTWSFEDSDGTYGYRRVHAHLARLGQHADPE